MECEHSRDKSAAGGASLDPLGNEEEPGVEQGGLELGSHLRARNMRLLGKEGLDPSGALILIDESTWIHRYHPEFVAYSRVHIDGCFVSLYNIMMYFYNYSVTQSSFTA